MIPQVPDLGATTSRHDPATPSPDAVTSGDGSPGVGRVPFLGLPVAESELGPTPQGGSPSSCPEFVASF